MDRTARLTRGRAGDEAAGAHPRPRHVGRRRRRPAGLVGLGLVIAGLSLLGWVGWQLWGTNWVSGREHRSTVTALERLWAADAPEPTTGAGTRAEVADAVPDDAVGILRIPALGEDYAVPLLTGVDDDALAGGVGVYPAAEPAGARGNFTLAGHRVTHGEPFARLPDLGPGDAVVVETRTAVHTYVLDTAPADLVVDMDAGWVLADRPHPPDSEAPGPDDAARLLTLTTCAELFHTDDRLVAFGHLVETVPRTP